MEMRRAADWKRARKGMVKMKKLAMRLGAVAAALLLCLGLTACGKANEDAQSHYENLLNTLDNPYETTAKIKYKDIEATARIYKKTPGYCIVEMGGSSLLDGLNFLFEKDSMTVDYKGLKVTMDPAQLPDSAIAKLLVSAIDQAAKKDGVSVSFEDTALVISGETADSTFYLKIDAADANVMTLSVPAEELEVEFVNFSFVNEEETATE